MIAALCVFGTAILAVLGWGMKHDLETEHRLTKLADGQANLSDKIDSLPCHDCPIVTPARRSPGR